MPFLRIIPIDLNINAPLAQFIFNWVSTFEDYYFFSAVSASFLVLLQAWMVNHLVVKHTILMKDSFLPALLFVLINSFYPQQMFLSPQLIANLFIILMFQRLCNLYESEKPLYIVLDSGLYLGMAVLFNYDTLIYLPFILISVILMTYFNIRFILASFFGLILPIYLLGVLFFMMDNLNDLIIIINNSLNRKIPWFLITIIVFASGISLQLNYFKNKVKTRRILITLVLYIVISVLLTLIEDHNVVFAVCYLSVPVSIIMANYFMSKKLVILKEILFLSLVITAVIFQYFI